MILCTYIEKRGPEEGEGESECMRVSRLREKEHICTEDCVWS